MHNGIDIAAPTGTPLYAIASGKIKKSRYNGGYGYHVYIEHGNTALGDLKSFYGHMNSLNVKEGQYVKAGDNIGTVGSTGVSTGPHLHFELRIDNRRVSPIDYLYQFRNNHR